MNSAIYSGTLTHSRYLPSKHAFTYHLKMILLDLDEVEAFFRQSDRWALERFGWVGFRRRDYLPDDHPTVKEAVRQTVAANTGHRPDGPVLMLANLRYLGMQFNPATFFYCLDNARESVTHLVIEVHNTPWNERHRYVLPMADNLGKKVQFDKTFHVSPFNPIDMAYHARFSFPGERISVQIENHRDQGMHFKAGLSLKRTESEAPALTSFAGNAWMLPIKIATGIYWQAFRLFLKRAPYYQHVKR